MDIDKTAVRIHNTAKEHGFWDKERNFGEMLMLVTSELAEALEEDRENRPTVWFKHSETCRLTLLMVDGETKFSGPGQDGCSCFPKPEGALVEIADAIIRLFDTGQHTASKTRYTLSDVIEMKMDYNDTRAHMHGKRY